MAKKKNKIKNKIALVIFFLIIVAIMMFTIYAVINLAIEPTDIFVVKRGDIYCEESTTAYLIREETIIKNEGTEEGIIQVKTEGEKVSKGDVIFRYYIEKEDQINKQIEETNKKIQEALEGQTGLFSSDIKALEIQIENTLRKIDKNNNMQEIREYKNDISKYINKKAKLTGSLSNAGEYINSLMAEKESLEDKLYSNANYVYSIKSGVLSYRIDGLEDILVTNDFSYVSSEFLEGLNLKTGQIITTSTNLGKIVNNYKCYIATILDSEEAKTADLNDIVYLRLSNKEEVKAKIEYIKEENNKKIIVFEINDGVEDLIEYRKISIDVIWWKDEGLKIPKEAIFYDNGLAYVIRNKNGHLDKILIEITEENNQYCIIDNYTVEKLKELGFSADEINDLKEINLYDEIVLKPDIEKTE